MAKKIICLIMSAFICVTALISCAGNSDNETEITTAASTDAETDALEARMATPDNLPETDLDGIEWRVYAQEAHVKDYFYSVQESGEVVNDAIFYANRTVEERFKSAYRNTRRCASECGW